MNLWKDQNRFAISRRKSCDLILCLKKCVKNNLFCVPVTLDLWAGQSLEFFDHFYQRITFTRFDDGRDACMDVQKERTLCACDYGIE